MNKVVLAGPWLVEDDTAFVPTPVDTNMVSKLLLLIFDRIFSLHFEINILYGCTDKFAKLH